MVPGAEPAGAVVGRLGRHQLVEMWFRGRGSLRAVELAVLPFPSWCSWPPVALPEPFGLSPPSALARLRCQVEPLPSAPSMPVPGSSWAGLGPRTSDSVPGLGPPRPHSPSLPLRKR
jgi:hypothetical protein